jgi:hypothetical protein
MGACQNLNGVCNLPKRRASIVKWRGVAAVALASRKYRCISGRRLGLSLREDHHESHPSSSQLRSANWNPLLPPACRETQQRQNCIINVQEQMTCTRGRCRPLSGNTSISDRDRQNPKRHSALSSLSISPEARRSDKLSTVSRPSTPLLVFTIASSWVSVEKRFCV